MNHYQQRGFSLVEVLLVLGIIAVLAIAAFIIYPQVMSSSRANTEQSNIMSITAATKNLYQGRYGAAGTNLLPTINQARGIPNSMNGGDFSAGAVITSSWGGGVALETVAGATGGTAFSLSYQDVPFEVCHKLIPALIPNFDTVLVGATTLTKTAAPADIVGACGTSGAVDVVMTTI